MRNIQPSDKLTESRGQSDLGQACSTGKNSSNKFRAIALWVIALVIIGAIELLVWIKFNPSPVDRTNFLEYKFAAQENLQRSISYLKLRELSLKPADILQVGDSSGMHGVVPSIMQSKLNADRYLNMNVATTLGYIGYYSIARYVLENQLEPGRLKYLVLYTSMIGGVPREFLWHDRKLIGADLEREFVSPFYNLFQIPSLGFRREVSQNLFYFGDFLKTYDAPLTTNRGYMDARTIFNLSNGWVREHDVPGDVPRNVWANLGMPDNGVNPEDIPDEAYESLGIGIPAARVDTFFDWVRFRRVSYMEHIYGLFYELAEQHGVKLLVVFNPNPETSPKIFHSVKEDGTTTGFLHHDEIVEELKRMRSLYPDAYFQTEFDFWPDHQFSVFSHVATPFSAESSESLANRLIENGVNFENSPVEDSNFSRSATIDMTEPFGGYGWIKEGAGDALLNWIGPRDAAIAWTAVDPSASYRLIAEIGAGESEAKERLTLIVNGEIATNKKLDDDGKTVSWQIPSTALERWKGWLMITFTTRTETKPDSFWGREYTLSAGKSLSIQQLHIGEFNQQ